MSKYETGLNLIRAKWENASDIEREQILLELKRDGLSIVEVIRALREANVFSLKAAKQYVASSEAWQAEAQHGDDLHVEIIEALREFSVAGQRK